MESEQFDRRIIHCILLSKSFRSVYLQLIVQIGIDFIRLNLARACDVINPPMVCIVYGVTIGNIHTQARAGVSGSSIWAPVRRTGTFAAVFVPYLPSFTFVSLRTHTTTRTHRPRFPIGTIGHRSVTPTLAVVRIVRLFGVTIFFLHFTLTCTFGVVEHVNRHRHNVIVAEFYEERTMRYLLDLCGYTFHELLVGATPPTLLDRHAGRPIGSRHVPRLSEGEDLITGGATTTHTCDVPNDIRFS